MAFKSTEDKVAKNLESSLGQCGAVVIASTDAHAGPFVAVTALAASTFDAATVSNIDSLGTTALAAGQTIFGTFSSLKFSGTPSVIAYRRCD